jgi:hypothetical protein
MVYAPPARLLRSPGPRVSEDVSGVAVAGVASKRPSDAPLVRANMNADQFLMVMFWGQAREGKKAYETNGLTIFSDFSMIWPF